EGFRSLDPLSCYAVKANDAPGVLRLLAHEGFGAEVVSGGELALARAAGIPGRRIVFSGVGKTASEIAAALRAGILLFNVESLPELRSIATIARRMGRRAPVALRINPNVDAHTHRYITTGTSELKFGIDWTRGEAAFAEAARLPGIDLAGIHSHIGSQLTARGPFVAAARRINALLDRLARRGIVPRYRNLGGGLGISYRPDVPALDAAVLARALAPLLRGRPQRLILEPGRFLVGEAGVLLARIEYVKRGLRKTFVITDAGMDNLIRPSLYEAHHEIAAVVRRPGAARAVDVVGPVCESADFLGLGRRLPPLRAGDVLAVFGAGAYGQVMASNYNARRRAPEVLVDGRTVHLLRRRETYADMRRRDA
ncbi:MAG: diaminopimelate decarboxylase, partial [bacterium]